MQTLSQQTQLGYQGPAHELSSGKKALAPHERFAGLLGHMLRMIVMCRTNFTKVGPFVKILAETAEQVEVLHAETGLLPRFPMRCLVAGNVALLYFYAGKLDVSLPYMTQCVRLALRDPLARCCFPIAAIIRDLDLLRPIYRPTAAYGHFGRELPDFTWERTDRADALKAAVSA